MTLTERVLNRVIDLARRTPYFHLHHADGSLYMERYWIVPGYADGEKPVGSDRWFVKLLHHFGIAIRLHCIHTPDLDREMHDHPWTFLSVVLRGWYAEARPVRPERAEPEAVTTYRGPGSYALRRFHHRHRITQVSHGGVWTLFVTFRKRQAWGFYTEQGKIWWWKFDSVHNNKPVA